MLRAANELRHRLSFRLWCSVTRSRLRRAGGSLEVDAPHGARLDSWPHVDVRAGETVRLQVGRGVKLGRATHLDLAGGRLSIGDGTSLMHGVRIQLLGGTVQLGAHVNVRDGVVLKSEGDLLVGYGVQLSYGATLHCVARITIGDHAGLAERVTVIDSDHTHHGDERPFLAQPLKVEPVSIGANAFVGANAVVRRGARVGANSVVAAGSVVGPGEHPDGWLLAGSPAVAVRGLGQPAERRSP